MLFKVNHDDDVAVLGALSAPKVTVAEVVVLRFNYYDSQRGVPPCLLPKHVFP